ncbi:MAG: polysaccharide deacetylase family protein [Actinomycetota bacterium]
MISPWTRPVTLVYHGVNQVTDAEDPSRLVVSPDHLHSQLMWLKDRGYRFETATQLAQRDAPALKIATVTFDDGWADTLDTVALLRDWDVVATFFVCPGLWGSQHPDVAGPAGALLTREQATELASTGIDLGSHSMSHPDLTKLDDDRLAYELATSKAQIEDLSGRECPTLAYPFGLYDDRVSAAAQAAGYRLAFAWLPGPWKSFAAPRLPGPPRHGSSRLALKMMGLRRRT